VIQYLCFSLACSTNIYLCTKASEDEEGEGDGVTGRGNGGANYLLKQTVPQIHSNIKSRVKDNEIPCNQTLEYMLANLFKSYIICRVSVLYFLYLCS